MANPTARLALSKPAGSDSISAFPASIDATLDTLDATLIIYRGVYSAETTYAVNDLVSYNNGLYVATSITTGDTPPGTHWVGGGGTGGGTAPVTTTQSGQTYTLATGDADSTIEFTNSNPVTVTIPTNATAPIPVDATIQIELLATNVAGPTVTSAWATTAYPPFHLGIGPDGTVYSGGGGVISKYAPDGTVTSGWAFIWADYVAVAPNGTVYGARDVGNSLSRAAVGGVQTDPWATVTRPSSIAVGPDGTVYASTPFNNGQLFKVTAGSSLTTYGPSYSGSGEVVVASNGTVYWRTNNGVARLTAGGDFAVSWAAETLGSSRSIGVSPDGGTVYTLNDSAGTVSKITGLSDTINGWATVGGTPSILRVAPDGTIYTLDLTTGHIGKVTPAGVVTSPWATVGTGPVDLAVAPNGTVYVAHTGSSTITKVVQAVPSSTLTVVGAGGVTVRSTLSPITVPKYGSLELRKRATDDWIVTGDQPDGAHLVYRGDYNGGTTYAVNDVVSLYNVLYIATSVITGEYPPGTHWAGGGSRTAYRGAYDAGTLYLPNEIVTYDGNMYIAITTVNPGETPPPGSSWVGGGGLLYRGVYDPAIAYHTNDVVVVGNVPYIAMSASTGDTPPGTHWVGGGGGGGGGSSTLVVSRHSGTSYTLVSDDADKLIEFTSNTPVTVTIPTQAVAAIPDTAELRVTLLGEDLPEAAITSSWATAGPGPQSIAAAIDGTVYTVNYGDSTVSKITPAGVVTTAWATIGTSPTAMAVAPDGTVYVLVNDTAPVSKVTPAGVATVAWATLADIAPTGIAVAADGTVYVVGFDYVSKITSAGTVTDPWATLATGCQPVAIAIATDGTIFTANQGNRTISKITSAGTVTDAWVTLPTDGLPVGLTIMPNGKLYVACQGGTDPLYQLTATDTVGDIEATWGLPGIAGSAPVVDANGYVYVVGNTSAMFMVMPDGHLISDWAAISANAYGLAIAPNGTLYVSDTVDNTVSKIVAVPRTNSLTVVGAEAVTVLSTKSPITVPRCVTLTLRRRTGDEWVVTGLDAGDDVSPLPLPSPGPFNAGDATWTAVTYQNLWADFSGGDAVQYRKDALGFVHLRGTATAGTASTVFTLPVGYRPDQPGKFNEGAITVGTDGAVVAPLNTSTDFALHAGVYVSSDYGGAYNASCLNDGSDSTRWSGNSAPAGQWATIDMGSPFPISVVRLKLGDAAGYTVRLQASDDNTNFTDVVDLGTPAQDTTTRFVAQTHRYWRILCTAGAGTYLTIATLSLYNPLTVLDGVTFLASGESGQLFTTVAPSTGGYYSKVFADNFTVNPTPAIATAVPGTGGFDSCSLIIPAQSVDKNATVTVNVYCVKDQGNRWRIRCDGADVWRSPDGWTAFTDTHTVPLTAGGDHVVDFTYDAVANTNPTYFGARSIQVTVPADPPPYIGTGGVGSLPAHKTKSTGDLNITATTWTDLYADGSFDLTLQAAPGDLIEFNLDAQTLSGTGNLLAFDVVALASGNLISGGLVDGVTPWRSASNFLIGVSGAVLYGVQVADVVNHRVIFRLQAKVNNGNSAIYADGTSRVLAWSALNLSGSHTADGALKGDAVWTTPTLTSGVTLIGTAYGETYGPPQYRKDALGFVHIQGSCACNNNTVIFTLPVGLRPDYDMDFPASQPGIGLGVLSLRANGDVSLGGTSGDFVLGLHSFLPSGATGQLHDGGPGPIPVRVVSRPVDGATTIGGPTRDPGTFVPTWQSRINVGVSECVSVRVTAGYFAPSNSLSWLGITRDAVLVYTTGILYQSDGRETQQAAFEFVDDEVSPGMHTYTVVGGSYGGGITVRNSLTADLEWDIVTGGGRERTKSFMTIETFVPAVGLTDTVYDPFTRANSGTSLGSADTGQPWVPAIGTWGIIDGSAYVPGGDAYGTAVINTGLADCTTSLRFANVGGVSQGNAGIIFRYQDVNNFLIFVADGTSGQLYVFKRSGGGFSTPTSALGAFAAGDYIAVTTAGNDATLKKNGVAIYTYTDSFIATTGLSQGMWANGNALWHLDNFTVHT